MTKDVLKKIFIYANIGSAVIMSILFIDLLNYAVHSGVDSYQDYLFVSNLMDYGDAMFYVGFFAAVSMLFSLIMLIQGIGKKNTAISILVPSIFVLLCMIAQRVMDIIESSMIN